MEEDHRRHIRELRARAMRLPLQPGVYLMHDASGEIIYIGKAKTLKNGSGLAVIGLIFSILGFAITAFVWIYVLVTVNTL